MHLLRPARLLGVSFGIICLGFLFLGFRYFFPVNPKQEYFPAHALRIGEIGWLMREFQPVVIYLFEKDKLPYMKAGYRDANGRFRLIDIRLAQMLGLELESSVVQTSKTDWRKFADLAEYRKYFRFGQRVRVTYLANVSPGEDEYDASDLGDPQVEEYCKTQTYMCEAANITRSNQEVFRMISSKNVIPANVDFLAIYVSLLMADTISQ